MLEGPAFAVPRNMTLQYAAAPLRADKEVVIAAVVENGDAIRFASVELRADKEMMMTWKEIQTSTP